MKYFQILLLLGIFLTTILFGQSIVIPHKMMSMQDTTINIPIYIYNVINLESITLKIEYDASVILAEKIIEDPVGILDDYTFCSINISDPGIIHLSVCSNLANVFSGSGMIAQISFQAVGQLGDFSPLKISDAQIGDESEAPRVHGSVEIVLDELTITAVDQSGIGSDDSITLGMCATCTDGWRYGEDEYDSPNPFDGYYTNLNFYHYDWIGAENGNICNCDPNCQCDVCDEQGINAGCSDNFASDHRRQHSFRELTEWNIKVRWSDTSNVDINLKWEPDSLITNSGTFKMFLYVGDSAGIDMGVYGSYTLCFQTSIIEDTCQEENSYTILQSELENTEANIWVKMGGCADTGETSIYYRDFDNDGWGRCTLDEYENCLSCEEDPYCVYFCEGLQPTGWASNHTDLNDDLSCPSNNIDDCNICEGFNENKDCTGECFGSATEDLCGVCNGNNDCVDCNGIAYGNAIIDCNDVCDGDAYLDNCLFCVESESDECELDCNGTWGGALELDDCDICGGIENNGNGICDIICQEEGEIMDCSGDCGGLLESDECGNCDNDPSNDCQQDCNGVLGGIAVEDICGVCDNDPNNNEQCLDCNGEIDGVAYIDSCGVCDNDPSNNCQQDCNNEWGGGAVEDECGVCGGDNSTCVPDCLGEPGGLAVEDICGVCGGDNSTCVPDCLGVPGGLAALACGVCDIDPNNNEQCLDCNGEIDGVAYTDNCGDCVVGDIGDLPCELDCNGAWGGTGILDTCGTCDGPGGDCTCPDGQEMDCAGGCGGSAVEDNCDKCDSDPSNDCQQDCNDVWGGGAVEDECEICDADPNNNDLCLDCNGIVNGLAKLDNCGNCIEEESDISYECSMDCNYVWGGILDPVYPCSGVFVCSPTDCILDINDYLLLTQFDINRIYPNPFNPQATIDFEVSEPTRVHLNIYNLKGQTVEVLINEFILPGYYSVIWNGTNHPSGIYFVILHSSNSIVKQKMMLIK